MNRFFRILTIPVFALACALSSHAAEGGYYTAIQKDSANPIPAAQFHKLEQDALKNYLKPESYDALARAFGNTTERAWAVIYGEVYCNLTPESDRSAAMGALIYQWYDKSMQKDDGKFDLSLTEDAEAGRLQVPFESTFETTFLAGVLENGTDVNPLTIRSLVAIRQSQLNLWGEKHLPQTAYIQRLLAISAAGDFEAYNYWLFRGARPEEFKQWSDAHQSQYKAWLDWQAKNKFSPKNGDFQRPAL